MMSKANNSPIIVLGGDGYLGWPLSLRLARRNRSRRILLVDNLLRRQLVAREGGDSLLPIQEPEQRLAACRSIYRLRNMEYIHMDVCSDALESLIKDVKPAAIYHLAQQCSAPYSMRGDREALFTLRNNEESNMRLLWAVKRHVPDCHIIKLGTFGEYAKCGLDIAEGYFTPAYNGKTAEQPMPYPRQADDFYHASKINDTNYISVACRMWGLRITDIMQSTIFGSWTPDIEGHEELNTRLDYDECFGTVVNRFLAQAICGLPLTVYGSGHQRTGLMSLNDSISSLAEIWETPPPEATHRVINHLTEDSFSINELADTIRDLAGREGFPVDVQRGVHDPRCETPAAKQEFGVERRHITENVQAESLSEVVSRTLYMLLPHRDRINTRLFTPTTFWNTPDGDADAASAVVIPLGVSQGPTSDRAPAPNSNETTWETFRREHFPYRHINLNPGTLGTPSRDVLDAMQAYQAGEVLAQPLAQYRKGKEALAETLDAANRLWPSRDHTLQVSAGASQCSNLLALGIARKTARLGRPLRLLTTPHEHIGGLGAFEKMPEFEICYLTRRELRDPAAFKRLATQLKPDIGFFSHIAYDTGHILPVTQWAEILKTACPEACVLIDISQSLGLMAPPFEHSDAVFGSCHKWLFGPRGTGLLWTTADFRQSVGALHWSGEPLAPNPDDAGFSPAGGMDFSALAGMAAALQLHEQLGTDTARERSAQLARSFRPKLSALLERHGIAHNFLTTHDGRVGEAGVLTVSFPDYDPYPVYHAMNQRIVHAKCIKDRGKDGRDRRLLRFGLPCYETEARLAEALTVFEQCLAETGAARVRRAAASSPFSS